MERSTSKQKIKSQETKKGEEEKFEMGLMYDMLCDPLQDRKIKDLPLPPNKPMRDEVLFLGLEGGNLNEYIQSGRWFLIGVGKLVSKLKPNWRLLKQFLQLEGELSKEQVKLMCKMVVEIIKKEPNLMQISEPVVIVGDIHGQYYDLCHMLEKAGDPKIMNYLFLGDYVDRGIFGTRVLLVLMAMKIVFP